MAEPRLLDRMRDAFLDATMRLRRLRGHRGLPLLCTTPDCPLTGSYRNAMVA